MKISNLFLITIVFSQFCCTSLWFATNGAMSDLMDAFGLGGNILGYLTSSAQLGFIIGTLIFAIATIADRYSPSRVFVLCAILGAITNLGIIWQGNTITTLMLLRFTTGFFLAGIYPVGMKIAADHYGVSLVKSLGYLVGALTLGTALPHLLKDIVHSIAWQYVIVFTSVLAILGGLLMWIVVPDGPYRVRTAVFRFSAFVDVFNNRSFRSAALGYFGHMWELYTFWAFVPIILISYFDYHNKNTLDYSLLSFAIIGIGSVACIIGGYVAQRYGTKKVAITALMLSCFCGVLSPLIFMIDSEHIFLAFMLFWGMVVIMDSPLFSTLVAQSAPPESKGTALTIVTCIGFSVTIISIQLIGWLSEVFHSPYIFTLLAIGPMGGLVALISQGRVNALK